MRETATTHAAYTIRPIEPGDRAALTRFYETLSADSLSERFHGACRGIADRAAGRFCGPDHEHREGIVAILPGDGGGPPRIVGHLCLEPSAPGEVEMAVAVADAFRRRGIGRALLAGAIGWAHGHGVGRLRASMRWSNGAIISLVRSSGHAVTWSTPHDADLEATIDVEASLPSAA
jgi:GNAT superfamily N-acetyltransferase